MQEILNKSFNKFKDLKGGANASYIPYLASVPSNLCAAVIITADGEIFKVGDYNFRFAIESISKVITLSLALAQFGSEDVRKKIGDSPTGLGFNSVMALELHKDKPLSPLVNAGAMATTSLIKAKDKEDRWNQILNFQKKMMSDRVELSCEVNKSEQDTNFHNRAIAWLLYSANHMFCDPMEACEIYTRGCSTLVDCIDLATLGATLANNGISPLTKEKILDKDLIPKILAQMMMEGMYDSSGDWAYEVGLPSKSGVGGGVLSIVPNKLAIAAFSPPLDKIGNSIRAMTIIKEIAKEMKFNIFV